MSKTNKQTNVPVFTTENGVINLKNSEITQVFDALATDLEATSNSTSKQIEESADNQNPKFEVSIASKKIDFSLKTANAHLNFTKINADKKMIVGVKNQESSLEFHKTVGKPLSIQLAYQNENTQHINGSTIVSSLSGKSVFSSELVNFSLVQKNKETIKARSSNDSDSTLNRSQVVLTDQISVSLKFGASEKNSQLTIENTKTTHRAIASRIFVDANGQEQKIIDNSEKKNSGGLFLGRSSSGVFFQHENSDLSNLGSHLFHKTEEQQRLELGMNQKGIFVKASESVVDTVNNSGQKINLTMSDHIEASLKAHHKNASVEFDMTTKAFNFNQIANLSGKITYESESQTSYVTINKRGKNQTYGIGTSHNLGGGVCLNASIEAGNHAPTTAKLQLIIPLGGTSSNHKKECDVTKFPQLNLSSTENLKRVFQQIPISFDENNISRGL